MKNKSPGNVGIRACKKVADHDQSEFVDKTG